MSLGEKSVFKVEDRAMVEGLFIAWEKGFRRIEVECDNAHLIELLLAGGGAKSNLVELRLLHQLLHKKMEHKSVPHPNGA
ncbi:hypothetical protein PVK06_010802 [Gossypium arboreum]|uniref:RNase H type-1 domain-containing protein n=1 Tax=Gossypium arboreum TaxID=29729 RepID=A0ABR0Q7Y3_GOSAR|nr:hypothetical protein PVK06_010802 [Gossypium arboreum]